MGKIIKIKLIQLVTYKFIMLNQAYFIYLPVGKWRSTTWTWYSDL